MSPERGEILAGLLSIDRHLAEFLVYGVSAGVVFFGLKAVGIAERFGTILLVGMIAAIATGTFSVPFQLSLELSGTPHPLADAYMAW